MAAGGPSGARASRPSGARAGRLLALLAGAVVLLAGLALLLSLLGGDDGAEVAPATGPGRLEIDRGARHLEGSGGAAPSPPERPATSGPHRPELLARDGRTASEDEHLHLLELGNVVLSYDAPEPPAALRALQAELAGAYDPELAAAGQAVALLRRRGLRAGRVVATAWRRRAEATRPDDPGLRSFAEAWLGQGAAAR